jgi:hypothetical protein
MPLLPDVHDFMASPALDVARTPCAAEGKH